MSSANGNRPTIEQLVERFHDAVLSEPFLTRREMAAEIGISLRSFQEYVNEGATPGPKARRKIHAWLEQRTMEPA